MSHKFTRLEHPWPAVLMHWAHLLAFFVLIGTGLQIHANSAWFGPIGTVSQVHFVAMYVFILTTIVRIYWAFFGAGSAALGGLTRHRDWRFFGLDMADVKSTPSWIAYYLFLRGIDNSRPDNGIYFDKPPAALVKGLTQCLIDIGEA